MQLKQQKAAAIGLAAPIPVKEMVKERPEEMQASVEVPTQEVSTVTEDAISVVETSAVGVEMEEAKPDLKAEVEKTPSKSPKKKSKAAAAAAAAAEPAVPTATAEATPVKSAKKKGKAAAAAEPPVTERAELFEKDVTETDAAAEVAVVSEVTEAESVAAVDVNEVKEEEQEPHLVQLEEVPEESLPTPVKAQMVAETEKVVNSFAEAEAEDLVHTPAKFATTSDFVHSTPVPSTTVTKDEAGENQETSSSAALTPTNAEARPHADSFTSPLVEFHHAYKIKEIGIPVVDNDEGDVNPMKRGMHSPVVNYNNTYPELEEECELLIEMEVDEDLGQSTDEERDTTGPDSASEAGDLSFTFNSHMINSASNSVTSNRSQSKMRDINPMTRPSPGKGSRVRLDIAQGMSENDAETVVVASEEPLVEEKVDSPGTDAESSGPAEKIEVEGVPHKDAQVEQNEACAENNTAEEGSAPEVVEVAPGSPARTVRSLRFAVYSGPTIAAAETADSNE